MDALIKAAIESLTRKTLPELMEQLQLCLHSGLPLDDADLIYTIKEAQEILLLLSKSASKETPVSQIQDSPYLRDSKSEESQVSAASASKSSESSVLQERVTKETEIKSDSLEDADALAMLSAMEETPAGDMSDDEARRMLAEMDAPLEAESTDMNEDEARRLLAEMDAPAEADDMDDAEARRLLAEMDAPPAPEAKAAPAPVKAAPATPAEHHSDVDSHDEEELVEIPEWEANEFQSDPSMLSDFITNSDELMQALDDTVLQLEQDPTNKNTIEEIFRSAHTLKGASGMFGFKGIERVMHRMENLFDLIRKEKLRADSRTIDVVFRGLDTLRTLLAAIKNGAPCNAPTVPVVRALGLAAKGIYPESKAESAPATAPASNGGSEISAKAAPAEHSEAKGAKKKDNKEQSTIRVDLERLDVLVNLVGELVIDRSRFSTIESILRTNHPEIPIGSSFSETVQLFGRHMNEIQDIIMKVRMVPIGNAFNKYTRIIRDLSRSLDKKIDLIISGEEAELDKTLVEQIGDPLIHLIRNACDHGIEMPDVRIQKGKDATGKVYLSAAQEGNHIVIKIQDDGKGMDPAIIRKKAIEKGIISEDAQLADRDILMLIFEAGFSTAEKVTNISGRGVGMDVVKRQIMKLKGSIDLESRPGHGMTVTIRLPLTLAIVQSLLVKARGETFAIPLNSVIESIRIAPQEIQKVGDSAVYKLRDTVLPLVRLDEALELPAASEAKAATDIRSRKRDRHFVVVVGHPERPTGIIVDQLLNQQEMVIKSMGPLMKGIPCVSGGAVLGQGEVVLVLDVPEIEALGRSRGRNQAA